MTRTYSLLSLSVGILAVWMGGCQSGGPEQTAQNSPSPSPSPSATPPAQSQPFSGTVPAPPKVPGLIPATNPEQRRQEISKGRTDPFALIPVTPKINTPPSQIQPQPAPKPASKPSSPSVTKRPSFPPTSPLSPPLPPLPPAPEIAQKVVVTGVILVGGVPLAIVKAPDEQFSRYVQPGQYISNGQVLVKRVQVYPNGTPVVVLEELGQEVYKQVGEGVKDQEEQKEA